METGIPDRGLPERTIDGIRVVSTKACLVKVLEKKHEAMKGADVRLRIGYFNKLGILQIYEVMSGGVNSKNEVIDSSICDETGKCTFYGADQALGLMRKQEGKVMLVRLAISDPDNFFGTVYGLEKHQIKLEGFWQSFKWGWWLAAWPEERELIVPVWQIEFKRII